MGLVPRHEEVRHELVVVLLALRGLDDLRVVGGVLCYYCHCVYIIIIIHFREFRT